MGIAEETQFCRLTNGWVQHFDPVALSLISPHGSRNHILDDFSMHIGKSETAAFVEVGQAFVINDQQAHCFGRHGVPLEISQLRSGWLIGKRILS